MTWNAVQTISLKTNWQYSDPVEGEYFRFKHRQAPRGSYYQVAQAQFNSDNSIDFAGGQILEVGKEQEYDTLRLEKPGHFTDRRIAIRKIPQAASIETVMRSFLHSNLFRSEAAETSNYPSSWSVDIEVSDYVTPASSSSPSGGSSSTPISTSDSYFSSVVLLLHFDGADGSTVFTDVKGHSITAIGDTKISTAQSKFGKSSAYFDGSGDCLQVANGLPPLGSEDFTIEGWIYLPIVNSFPIFGQWNPSGYDPVNYAFSINTNRKLALYQRGVSDYTWILEGTSLIDINQWFHVALSRSGNVFRLFTNGKKEAEGTFNVSIGSTSYPTYIMHGNIGSITTNAYLDEFRITKGVARYVADFAIPTAPFPNS